MTHQQPDGHRWNPLARRWRRWGCLAGVVILVAATVMPARPQGVTLTVSDRTGNPRWQAASRYAVDAWNSSGAGVQLKWAEGGIGCQVEAGGVIPVCRRDLAVYVAGLAYVTQRPEGYVLVSPRFDQRSQVDMNGLVLHEVGHVLGLEHDLSPGSIMGPRGNGTDHLSQGDHAALRALWP